MGFEELKPTYDTYSKFAAKRQEVFFNRLGGGDYPWTDDKIIKKYKFTNAYRASDRVSQYLTEMLFMKIITIRQKISV